MITILIITSIILGGLSIPYYVSIITKFAVDDYDTKRGFLLDLIPFYLWVRSLREIWNDLD